jgi:hypothetical protein
MKLIISESQLKTIVEQVPSLLPSILPRSNVKIPMAPLPTPQEIMYEIKRAGIIHPEIAYAQALLETGHFKSAVFIENHNLFGMKLPSQRQTLAIGKNRGHAKYKTWQDSVKDYKMWQDAIKVGDKKIPVSQTNKEGYLALLSRVYCVPPDCKKPYGEEVRKLLGSTT